MERRAVAFKASIKELLESEFHPSAGDYDPNYVKVNGRQVIRVNLIARVAETGDALVLEDPSGRINARSFEGPLDARQGSTVRVIGKVRENNGERFVAVEALQEVNEKNLELRKFELEKRPKQLKKPVNQKNVEESKQEPKPEKQEEEQNLEMEIDELEI
jgi:hypothetical protein